jgi:arylsulfatase A-like enzyme
VTPASGPRTWSTTTTRSSRRAPPEQGYHLTEDLADKAIEFIADAKQIAPNKPFYLHFCTGATHAPHHVPKEWADRYAGQFDDGWEAYRERVLARQKEFGVMPANAGLSRHDPDVPEWGSLSSEARRLAARMMECLAGSCPTPTTTLAA